ncbi:MAG: M1 family aminopeptidase [Vicinamibacterales bacterium]
MPSTPVRMLAATCLIVCLAGPGIIAAQPQAQPAVQSVDGVTTLLRRLQQAVAAGDRVAVLALGDTQISRPSFEEFATTLTAPPATRVVVTERDRAPHDAGSLRLVVEIFTERGIEGRLGTWRVDARPGNTAADPWRIAAVSRLSVITGLYRLALDTATEYDISNLVVRAPDLTIEVPSGRAFLASTTDGPTAMVILGRGRMKFSPPVPAERTQVRILSGHDELVEDIDLAFLRFAPSQFVAVVDKNALKPRSVDLSDAHAAVGVFNDLAPRSLQVDLSDISRDRWSLTPGFDDVIAELRTKRFGTLTYARSHDEPEDINLFDRKRRRNISIYTSAAKLAQRGRFYSEDERLDYDVLAYDIDVQFTPDRSVIDGDARMKLKILSDGTSSLTLKLAETVAIRGVYSPDFGRLLHLRVVGQSSIIVNLPEVLAAGTELWLDVRYGGPVAPQAFDREAIQIGQPPTAQEQRIEIPLQPRYLYSNRSYWYPQSTVTDYATATIRVTVPADYDAIATGQPVESPTLPPGGGETPRRRKTYVFESSRPVRYLAVIVSHFNRLDNARVSAGSSDVLVYLQGTPRAPVRVKETSERTAAILSFYASLLGDAPYPSFTLALAESDRPGGHSPPYFAVLNQLMPASTIVWRNDPVSFENFPAFFLAHELAHQWWGQAVGWKNYHEQWLSEAFAQYFAVLYAEKDREGGMSGILRQMRRTAVDASPDGPIYLGYRLGHIQGDDRIFRAVVYNKGAMVLHMLRRLIGEDAFFGGLRAFYQQWKFRKAGTDDFREVMERASGRDLRRFFDTWIFGSAIPHIKFTSHVSATDAIVNFEQQDDIVDVPITVTIAYESGTVESFVIILTDKHTERAIPLKGRIRTIAANADYAALVEIDR